MCPLHWERVTLESLLGQQSVPDLIGHSPLEKNSLHFISTRGEEELRTRYITITHSLNLQSGEDPPVSQIWKPSLQDTLLHPAPPSISLARPQGPGCYRLCCWSSVGSLGCMTSGAVPLVQRTQGFGKSGKSQHFGSHSAMNSPPHNVQLATAVVIDLVLYYRGHSGAYVSACYLLRDS